MEILGQLQDACLEQLSSDPAANTQGRLYQNTTEGRTKLDDGVNKRALLRNDQKMIIGNDGTASNNVRFNRSGFSLLQLVLGNDTTPEGSLSANLAQLSMRLENYTNAGKPAFGNIGRPIFLTDLNKAVIDTGSAWKDIGLVLNESTDSTTTGSAQTLGAIGTTTSLRLTNASLSSVNMIPAGYAGQEVDLINRTGSTVTLLRLNGGTASQQIETGSGSDLPLPNGAAVKINYDFTTQKWQVIGVTASASTAPFAYRSVTTTDTATTSDYTLALSGASFTQTLYSAVGNKGKILEIFHDGTSLTQVYTLATGGETIGGLASGVIKLYTNGERFKLQSDNVVWKILNHESETPWENDGVAFVTATSAYVFTVTAANATAGARYSNNSQTFTVTTTIAGGTTLTCSGTGTPTASGTLTKVSGTGDATITFSSRTTTGVPVKPSGITFDRAWKKRIGQTMYYRFEYLQNNTTGAVNGTGDYLFSAASMANAPIDTTLVQTFPTVLGNTLFGPLGIVGDGIWANNTTASGTTYFAKVSVYDPFNVRMIGPFLSAGGLNTAGAVSGNIPAGSFNVAASVGFSLNFSYPVQGWQP